MRWYHWVGGGALLALAGKASAKAAAPVPSSGASGGMPVSGEEAERLLFVKGIYSAVSAVAPGLTSRTKAMIVAHAILESGWGKAKAAREGNNLFNLTRLATDSGPVIIGPDQECTAAGVCKPITQRFRAYSSYRDSISDYLNFITAARYTNAKVLLLAGDVGFVSALYRGGYFTLPLTQYLTTYNSILSSTIKRLQTLNLWPVANA